MEFEFPSKKNQPPPPKPPDDGGGWIKNTKVSFRDKLLGSPKPMLSRECTNRLDGYR